MRPARPAAASKGRPRILFWRTIYLRMSLGVRLVAIPAFGALLAVYGV